MAPLCFAVGYLAGGTAGAWSGLVWGFFVSTVAVYHVTFMVNSVCHLFGTRRYATGDDSRNNWLVGLLTFGEGWHNNHHHYPSAARQGFKWWELDISYLVLKGLSQFGIVWDLRQPTPRALAAKPIT
jgi:stearoyl-CoA desaturase (delta-9 desaturase)